MGKPATAYFCGNGHLLEENPHHCYGPRDQDIEATMYEGAPPRIIPPCPYCGSEDEHCELEWGDPDYASAVPTQPIRKDDCKMKDHYGNTYYQLVPVYDIRSLKK